MSDTPDFASMSLAQVATFLTRHGRKDSVSAWLQGKALAAAKSNHPKEFTKWLRGLKFISLATAHRYMAIAKKFATVEEVGKLTITEVNRIANPQPKRGTKPRTVTPSTVRDLAGFVSSGQWRAKRAEWEPLLRDLLASVQSALAGEQPPAPTKEAPVTDTDSGGFAPAV